MAEAFLGYVLPWGQMSYHGAQVIVNLFGTVPFIGQELVEFIRGDYLISDATLNRFFALHVIALPLVLLLLVVLHLGALHEVGSNNPEGVDIKKVKDENGKPKDGIPFHPYYTVKDLFGVGFFLTIVAFVIFFEPTFGNYFLEYDNFNEANPQVTPEHIMPVWYFTPFYAMLRAVPDKLLGVHRDGSARSLILFLLPWLDRSPGTILSATAARFRSCMLGDLRDRLHLILGWLGLQSGQRTARRWIGADASPSYYFAFFITMPLWTKLDKTRPVPERVTTHD
jgi:ubiquinol-cytochrome c reductase cytochrome b subunit